MILTLAILYYIYLLCVALFIIWSLFNIYHLLRFGFLSWTNIGVILIYIFMSGFFILMSFELLSRINWDLILLDLTPYQNNIHSVL